MHRLGTFAETAVIDYRLSFADQGNKLPVSISVAAKKEVFRFQQTNRSCRFVLFPFLL
jgi:hypothetical protein